MTAALILSCEYAIALRYLRLECLLGGIGCILPFKDISSHSNYSEPTLAWLSFPAPLTQRSEPRVFGSGRWVCKAVLSLVNHEKKVTKCPEKMFVVAEGICCLQGLWKAGAGWQFVGSLLPVGWKELIALHWTLSMLQLSSQPRAGVGHMLMVVCGWPVSLMGVGCSARLS